MPAGTWEPGHRGVAAEAGEATQSKARRLAVGRSPRHWGDPNCWNLVVAFPSSCGLAVDSQMGCTQAVQAQARDPCDSGQAPNCRVGHPEAHQPEAR